MHPLLPCATHVLLQQPDTGLVPHLPLPAFPAAPSTQPSTLPLDSAGVGLKNGHSLTGLHTLTTLCCCHTTLWAGWCTPGKVHVKIRVTLSSVLELRLMSGLRVCISSQVLCAPWPQLGGEGTASLAKMRERRGWVLCCRDLQVQLSSDTHDHVWRGVGAFIQHSTPAIPEAELGRGCSFDISQTIGGHEFSIQAKVPR